MSDDDTAREVAREFAPTPRPLHATKHCRHYSFDRATMTPTCAWGEDLASDRKMTNACMPPGLQDLRVCPYREEFTDAERATWEEWRNKSTVRAIAILALIPGTSRKRDVHWGTNGRFDCPACGDGTVSWVRTKVNGHVHARCSTPACFEVME